MSNVRTSITRLAFGITLQPSLGKAVFVMWNLKTLSPAKA